MPQNYVVTMTYFNEVHDLHDKAIRGQRLTLELLGYEHLIIRR